MARHQDQAVPGRGEPFVEAERRPTRSDVGLAALLGLFVAVFVLWTPIAKLRTHTLGAWDHLSLLSPLTAVEPVAQPSNYLVLDPVRQMIPWALLARDELRAGRAPLWNEFDGGGIPLLGNYQSAVFSPFTLPFYVLPLSAAVLTSAALKLFTLTATMFLFLRALGRSRAACAIGALVYATSAFYALYLLHPHAGVHALLPLVLLFVERVSWSAEQPTASVRTWDVVGLALAFGLMALAGHPESFAFALYVVVGYSAWRLGSAALRTRGERARRIAVVRCACALLGAAALGAGLGAVQWLPFLEYLRHSAVAGPDTRSFETFSLAYWPLHLFPNLLGSAIGSGSIGALSPGAVASNTFNVGTCAFLLALSAPFIVRDRSLFFVVAGLLVLAYAYHVPWIGGLLAPVFLAGTAPMWPTNVVWIVGASVGTAAVIDAVLAARSRKPAIVLAVLALLAIAAFLAREHMFHGLAVLAGAGDVPMPDLVEAHVRAMTALALLGLAALAVLRLSARKGVRAACFVALGAAALLENTEPFRDYEPTVEDRFVFAAKPALGELARELHGERCVFLTGSGLYPNSNIQLGVHLISSYDAIEIREYDELRAKLKHTSCPVFAIAH